MAFEIHQTLVDESGEVDEAAASRYVEELARLFAESPEGAALKAQGVEPGGHLEMFLDYALRYVGANPAEMEARDVRETLDVFAEKVTGRPEDLDQLIPELEAFCDFVQRAFGLSRAVTWKREVQHQAGSFRSAVRDPRHWGMAKSMLMEGLARGYDLSTERGINEWMLTVQTERIAEAEATNPVPGRPRSIVERLRQVLATPAAGPALGEGASEDVSKELPVAWEKSGRHSTGPFDVGSAIGSGRDRSKEKARRKQKRASQRRNRRS